jgi:hypothetical protein
MVESRNVAGFTTRESVLRSMLETTNTHSTPGNRKAIFKKSYLKLTIRASGKYSMWLDAANELVVVDRINRVRDLLMQAMKELKEKSRYLKKNAPVCRVNLKA